MKYIAEYREHASLEKWCEALGGDLQETIFLAPVHAAGLSSTPGNKERCLYLSKLFKI